MVTSRNEYRSGRLTARPTADVKKGAMGPGLHALELRGQKEGLLYVPANYRQEKPASLALMLHGSGGHAEHGLHLLHRHADEHNIILLAPASQDYSWDVIVGESFDVDVIYIDQALQMIFEQYAIDVRRVAIGGFSDGASYALSLGLINGDLFTHIIAFSPGFALSRDRNGKPEIYISHGLKDPVLPIDPCSRRIVAQLKPQQYKINYQEFQGGHDIPLPVSESAVSWFTES